MSADGDSDSDSDERRRTAAGRVDVLGQGEEGPAATHPVLRRAVVVVAVLLGIAAVSRSGLLSSADQPNRHPRPSTTASAHVDGSPRLVARIGINTLTV